MEMHAKFSLSHRLSDFNRPKYFIVKPKGLQISTGNEIMVSTPYTRGRSREYQALRKLREEGWFCSRSAASHGPVDIFAGRKGQVLMVQVKSGSGRATETERELLRIWGKAFRGKVEIWRFRKGRQLQRETVYDDEKQSEI